MPYVPRALTVLLALLMLALLACNSPDQDDDVAPADDDDNDDDNDDDDDDDDDDSQAPEPDLQFDPANLDFGDIVVGCETTAEVSIVNAGTAPLLLTGHGFEGVDEDTLSLIDDEALTAAEEEGTPLDPEASIAVTFRYLPQGMDAHAGFFSVESNDPDAPQALATISGAGIAGTSYVDSFVQEANNWVDILWVIDDSASMAEEQANLASNLQFFFTTISAAGLDYRLACVGASDPSFTGVYPIVGNATPNAAATFIDNCAVGTGGANPDPFATGYQALSLAVSNTAPNDNFYRNDARLVVVFVTDAGDDSGMWANWVADYQALKTDPDDVGLSAICGTDGVNATACSGAGGVASAGTGFVEAVNATAGILGCICDANWSTPMVNLAWNSIHLHDTFELSHAPVIGDTIAVEVNGTAVTTGWIYDETMNAIVFAQDHVPQNGDSVDISYAVSEDC